MSRRGQLQIVPRAGAEPTAVLYLRVSTKEQAARGGEAEGFSIPAQREACTRKAEGLGATVVAEFIDAGESARSADRPPTSSSSTRSTAWPATATTTPSSPPSCRRLAPSS